MRTLVVGNRTYAHVGRLPNPGNDAADMSAALLRRLGFEVTTVRDAGQVELNDALRAFTRESAGGGRVAGVLRRARHGDGRGELPGSGRRGPARRPRRRRVRLREETMDIDFLGYGARRETLAAGGRGLAACWPHGSGAHRVVAGLAVLLVLSAGSSAMAQGRWVALVVGNDAYQAQGGVLRNAVNDARAVAEALEGVGFAVTKVEDADRAQLTAALSDFAGSLGEDDVALFYFAGHGVQVAQENYLLPTDYAGQTASALRFNAVSAVDVADMLRRARVAMLVFDACRNNPYRGVRGGTGLAKMEARGTLIAYAAGAGELASDGDPGESNGLFTSKFVEVLGEPGLTVSALFMRVRQEVVSASKEEQWPAVYNNLLSDFVFRPGDPPDPPRAVVPVADTTQQETVFWESIRESANAAEFEAYLAQWPSGIYAPLATNRLAALRPSLIDPPPDVRPRDREAGEVFRDCDGCPEMVVLPGGGLALGKYEVTVGEYRAFASATGGGGDSCFGGRSWRDPGFAQTDRQPVTCVSWDDAQEYVSWLSRPAGATYRLPTEAEWEGAAAGSQRGCDLDRTGSMGTCPVGSYGVNAAGLSDMVGNLYEWTEDCWEGDCSHRVLRGGSWFIDAEGQRPGARGWSSSGDRNFGFGFRVARTLD